MKRLPPPKGQQHKRLKRDRREGENQTRRHDQAEWNEDVAPRVALSYRGKFFVGIEEQRRGNVRSAEEKKNSLYAAESSTGGTRGSEQDEEHDRQPRRQQQREEKPTLERLSRRALIP